MNPEPVLPIKLLRVRLALPALIVAMALQCSLGLAADFKDAHAAYMKGDYAAAFSLATEQAKNANDRDARKLLAGLLFTGRGHERDTQAAIKIWSELAKEGDADSQQIMGALYLDGNILGATDFQRARQYLESAAAQGDAVALYNLGLIYGAGLGVPKSFEKSVDYYKTSAHSGYAKAYYQLAELSGAGLIPDSGPTAACRYYEKSAQAGLGAGAFMLGKCYATGIGMPKNFPLAKQWYEKGAMRGVPQAQANLGYLYEKGLGQKIDLRAAYKWYWLAANEVPEAARRLALIEKERPDIGKSATDQVKAAWRKEIADFILNDDARHGKLIAQ